MNNQEAYFWRLSQKLLDVVKRHGIIEQGELVNELGVKPVTIDRALFYVRDEVLTGKTKTRTVYIDAERAKR